MIKLKDLIIEGWNSNIWENDEPEEKEPIAKRLGRCYELCGKYVMYHDGWTLVHGKLTNPFESGHPEMEHAWVEKGDEIFDPVMHKIWPKQVYESLFKAKIKKKYSQREVFQITDKTANWGPWN